jgi:hypothetical protein
VSGFDVDPAALRQLAAAFETGRARLAAAVPPWRDTSYGVHDAFGMLGPSTEALEAFLDLTHRDSIALEDLADHLDRTAETLRVAAANYERAEGDSTIPGQGRP